MNQLVEDFSTLRKILCICPCCGEITRVSDLQLTFKKPAVKTWLDEYDGKVKKIEEKEESFEEKESKIRAKSVELGRIEAKKVFNRCIFSAFKKMKLNPYDIKPILNPIDFVIFDGMTSGETISKIVFLSKKTDVNNLNVIRRQVERVVDEKSYNWEVGRITEEGKLSYE